MYNYYPRNTNWINLIDAYGNAVLFHLGWSKHELRDLIQMERENQLTKVLRDEPDRFLNAVTLAGDGKVNLIGVCRLVVLAQIMVFDVTNGPDGDNKPKALRRHWYSYFKKFAQMFGHLTGNVVKNKGGKLEIEDLKWTQRLSQSYASFVDSGECTYLDLWVEDTSRMMEIYGWDNRLIDDYILYMGIEKDSLFSDFEAAARAAGAVALISGKGKNSKAATELMLRKLGWGGDEAYRENRMRNAHNMVIHLSDHDKDGEAVIGPTFGEQMRRYLTVQTEGRIGITPEQPVKYEEGELAPKGLNAYTAAYEVKVVNESYREWVNSKGVFMGTCDSCNYAGRVVGLELHQCPSCGSGYMEVDPDEAQTPRGYEVEALSTSVYYRELAQLIIDLIGWDDLVDGLRERCIPDAWNVAYYLGEELANRVEEYRKLQNAIDLLNRAANALVETIKTRVYNEAQTEIEDDRSWRYIGEDPRPEEYIDHVVSAGRTGYGEHWMPFSREERDDQIRDRIRENTSFIEAEISPLKIEDFEELVENVIAALE